MSDLRNASSRSEIACFLPIEALPVLDPPLRARPEPRERLQHINRHEPEIVDGGAMPAFHFFFSRSSNVPMNPMNFPVGMNMGRINTGNSLSPPSHVRIANGPS